MAPQADDSAATPLADGRYMLLEVLGEGGMATVYRARDARLQVLRAIKVLAPNLATKRQLRERFEAEARTMALFDHPNIVRVFDVGFDGDRVYIVMELVTGGSLLERVRDFGPLSPSQALDVTVDVLLAVQAAHERGIVHRDIKPHNILLTNSGQVRVTDFGIARLVENNDDDQLTRTGAVIGTWGFMAPEQKENAKAVDFRADIYSVGATLWSVLTNQTPNHLFAADIDPNMMAGIPEPLCELIKRATRYRREDRFPDAASMIAAANEVREQIPRSGPEVMPLVVTGRPRPAIPPVTARPGGTVVPDATPMPDGEPQHSSTLIAIDELDDTEPVTSEARLANIAANAAHAANLALDEIDDGLPHEDSTEPVSPVKPLQRTPERVVERPLPTRSNDFEVDLDGTSARTGGALSLKSWLTLAGGTALASLIVVFGLQMYWRKPAPPPIDPGPIAAMEDPTNAADPVPADPGPAPADPTAPTGADVKPPVADPPVADAPVAPVTTTTTTSSGSRPSKPPKTTTAPAVTTPTLVHKAVSSARKGSTARIGVRVDGGGAAYDSVSLSYRAQGATRWTNRPMLANRGQLVVDLVVEGDLAAGFEYFIRARASGGEYPELTSGDFLHPHRVKVE